MKIKDGVLISLLGIIALPCEFVLYMVFALMFTNYVDKIAMVFVLLFIVTIMLIIFAPIIGVCSTLYNKLNKE